LVVTLPEKGHYHPLLGPAAELAARGFDVAFACPVDIRDALHAAGVTTVLVPPGASGPADDLRGEALASIIADPTALRRWIRELLVDRQAELVEPLRRIIRTARPHVIAIDTMCYAAAIAAELESIPWVGWSTSLNPVVPADLRSDLIDTLATLDPARQAPFHDHGLTAHFRVSDVLSPVGTAAFTTRALVGPPPDGVRLVGPSLGGRRAGAVPDLLDRPLDRPLVYASFGSQAWFQPARFDKLIAAASDLGVALLAAMGDLAAAYPRHRLPAHVVCVDHVAQLAVLERADAIVTHGGANSVMEALASGVPALVSPICNDQPHNAFFLAERGAAVTLDLDTATVRQVTGALARTLDDADVRSNVAALAESYRVADGARGAADLAEEAAC
jgi:UDP:flavonoid glycosyltransferase YjiC (YdhE family)